MKLPHDMSLEARQSYVQKNKSAIPSNISFENVIQDKTLSPCTLEDFMVS